MGERDLYSDVRRMDLIYLSWLGYICLRMLHQFEYTASYVHLILCTYIYLGIT